LKIRTLTTVVQDSLYEAGQDTDPVLRKVGVVAVVPNIYAGDDYQGDLSVATRESERIGKVVAKRAVEAMGDFPVESYGKGGIVGVSGEQEHVVAMLTTVYGNVLRQAVGGGAAWISSATKRAAPGGSIDIPLAHKDALYVRSHYDAMTLSLPDAPLPNELAIIFCVSNRGRPNARVGGLRVDEIVGKDGLH
jgi:hypothetical protein